MKQEARVVDPMFELEMLQEIIPELPALDLTHIRRLTNQVAIVQHATYSVPNYKHGYCLDDTARALLLVTLASRVQPAQTYKTLTYTYIAYIQYMQRDCGRFRNFLSFDHRFLDDYGTEDSFGRTVWSLGYFIRFSDDRELIPLAEELLRGALPHCRHLKSVRAISYTLLGLQYYHTYHPQETDILDYILTLSYYLLDEYRSSSSTDWLWYEQVLTYDNSIIPLALLRSGVLTGQSELVRTGQQTAHFLDGLVFEKGYLSTIGNAGWYNKGGARSRFGQQPVEIPSSILLYKELYRLSGDTDYKQRMLQSMQWFFGKNELGLPLYDPVTKGCCDGLEQYGTNANQGAESSISFWLAYLFLCYHFD